MKPLQVSNHFSINSVVSVAETSHLDANASEMVKIISIPAVTE